MPRLIVVAGASGAGKTFMLSQLVEYRDDIIPIKKLTTRSHRKNEPKEESIDLIFDCKADEIKKCEYTYQYCGKHYGFKKQKIDSILRQNKNPIVIIAKCDTIAKIKRDYHDVLVLYINSGLSGEDLKYQLVKYRDPIDVKERMERQKNGFIDYVHHMNKGFFDYFLVNYYDDTFLQQLDYILEEELNDVADANYVFVIMSFNAKYNDIYDILKISGRLIKNRTLMIERVSEPYGDYIITERIEKSIQKAGLIICDITERSPNVYYELGYARAKNKTIIMTAKRGTELPFDVQQYKTLFYDNPVDLQKKIVKELEAYYS